MRTIKEVMDLNVGNFEFSVRCSNCMANMGITTLAELTQKSETEISKMRNIGRKSLEEIKNKLTELELSFQMNDKDWLTWGLAHIEWIKSH